MTWSTNVNPKQEGWYLVTVDGRYVMPAYRMEYPKGNFTWKDNARSVVTMPNGNTGLAQCVLKKNILNVRSVIMNITLLMATIKKQSVTNGLFGVIQ